MDIHSIWQEMYEPLNGFILKRVQDTTVSKDILHDVFLKMEKNIQNLKNEEKVSAWIYSITRNMINDYYRKKKNFVAMESVQILSDTGGVGEQKNDLEVMHVFSTCTQPIIGALPEKYREAVFLTEIKGMSQKDLAAHLGISYSAAKSRVQRGREQLKQLLLQCCEIETDVYGNVIDYRSKNKKSK